MNVIHLNGDVFDLDQVASQNIEANCIRLRFQNGDEISICWRDERERQQVLLAVSASPLSTGI